MRKSNCFAICAALLLASCGKPDVSGVYLAASDRMVTLVQIVENKDGALTGRLEQLSIKPDGTVKDETLPLDGAASGRELVFKPTSVLLGGLQASGTVEGERLTLTGSGITINATSSSLADFQSAVAHLQSVATQQRKKDADFHALMTRLTAQAQAAKDAAYQKAQAEQMAANQKATVEQDTARLRDDTAKMNAAISNCPDFGARAAANTARITRMVEVASTWTGVKRSQAAVAANGVEIDTNGVEIARSQYAIGLNQIFNDATPIAEQLHRFCATAQGTQFAAPCGPADIAVTDYKTSLARGRDSFNGYKRAIQDELQKQAALIRQING